MSAKTVEIETKTEALLLPIVEEHAFELVDVEYVKEANTWYLRAYIDKDGGITVDDCEVVSRALEAELDRLDFIEDSYILEVSSPGLDRPLKKEKDFIRAMGKEVEIHTYKPIDGEKFFRGTLRKATDEEITILTEEEEKAFSRKDVSLVRLAIDF